MRDSEEFNAYVSAYKDLSIQQKYLIDINELEEILSFIERFKLDLKINDEILFNKEIADVKKNNNISNDDFAEAVLVYSNSIKESLASYFEVIMKLLYKEGKK